MELHRQGRRGGDEVYALPTAGSDGAARCHALRPRAGARPTVRGKFFFVGQDKLYVRGTTYGTFRPNAEGELYPSPVIVDRDFARIARSGLNAVRTYTLPPRWLLDLAADNGLFVLVGIAWEQHVDFLEERWRARSIEEQVRAGVAACAGHPAVLCYAIGNEIPGQIVRWLGRRPAERFVARLYEGNSDTDIRFVILAPATSSGG